MSFNLKVSPSPPPFSFDQLPSSPPPQSPSSSLSTPDSPPTSWLSARDMKIFGADPLRSASDIGIVQCKLCAKPILRSAAAEHAETCKLIRLGKNGAKGKVEDTTGACPPSLTDSHAHISQPKAKSARPTSPSRPSPARRSPKRPSPPTKVTKGRLKGPVDLDKQCGVINDKNLQCSRSLTCKSHSMGAKRAVQGRSRPYDELLLEWNRANNPNFVEPVKRESKKERKEKKEREKRERKQREAATGSGG
ncbi:hypothetical protein EWM64_g10098 [Hericium alpestre]|uniref:SCA7 domain-containing protein n=1 Tax=Hericium alpestre TaxID=135208 RepID=A0A4Y9ZHL7_9AGAM|nr:hypothetical protein EWM64_g10098 [Hericium alpestre]